MSKLKRKINQEESENSPKKHPKHSFGFDLQQGEEWDRWVKEEILNGRITPMNYISQESSSLPSENFDVLTKISNLYNSIKHVFSIIKSETDIDKQEIIGQEIIGEVLTSDE